MIELWSDYWPVILVGLLIGMIVGYLVFRPRQRVTLSSDTPLRPHMAAAHRPAEPTAMASPTKPHAPTSDVAGQFLGTDVSGQLPGARRRARRPRGAQGRRSQARGAAQRARA